MTQYMFLYYFYSLITAPGVVIHELGHIIFCLFAGVKIHKIRLFQFGSTAGYVIHDEPTKFYQAFLISFGPLIVNSLLALFCFSKIIPPYLDRHVWVYGWLGIAIGLHAIPSTGDAKSLFHTINGRFWRNPLVMVGYPFVLILYILNFLKTLHIDFVYVAALFWLGRFYLKY